MSEIVQKLPGGLVCLKNSPFHSSPPHYILPNLNCILSKFPTKIRYGWLLEKKLNILKDILFSKFEGVHFRQNTEKQKEKKVFQSCMEGHRKI